MLEPSRLPPLTVMTRRCVYNKQPYASRYTSKVQDWWEGFPKLVWGHSALQTPAKCRGLFHSPWEKCNSPNSFSWRYPSPPHLTLHKPFGSDFCPRCCRWYSAWASSRPRRGRGFNLWPGKMPRAKEQPSPCAQLLKPARSRTHVPQLMKPLGLKPCSTVREASPWGARAPQRTAPGPRNQRKSRATAKTQHSQKKIKV